MEYDYEKYPMIWKRKSKRGYCFTAMIPCRVLSVGKRIEIAALLVGGKERIHRVPREVLKHDPCHCFGECRALERFEKKQKGLVPPIPSIAPTPPPAAPERPPAIPGSGLAVGTGRHKYPGCEVVEETGMLSHFFTSDCAYECGCWMGGSRSGGPDGVDPFGACPNAPVETKK